MVKEVYKTEYAKFYESYTAKAKAMVTNNLEQRQWSAQSFSEKSKQVLQEKKLRWELLIETRDYATPVNSKTIKELSDRMNFSVE
jgi:hypothetical protein